MSRGLANVGPLTYTRARFLIGALFILSLAAREYRRLTRREPGAG